MLRVPGIGTIHGFCARSHAREICAGDDFFLFRELPEKFDNRHICRQVFSRKTREPGSQIRVRVERRLRIYFIGKIPLSNRAPWDEADAQFLTSFKNPVVFRVSLHERVFGLNC